MVSPDSQAIACPLSGRNSTYRPVQISGAGSDLAGAPQCEGNCVGKDFSLCHGPLEHKENKRASRYILCTAPQEAQAGAEREGAAAWTVSKSRWIAKKEPRAVHSRGLQLALFDALLSRRLGGVGGRG